MPSNPTPPLAVGQRVAVVFRHGGHGRVGTVTHIMPIVAVHPDAGFFKYRVKFDDDTHFDFSRCELELLPDPADKWAFRNGTRFRDKHTGRFGTIKTGSPIHGGHYHVAMDEGFETLLLAAEMEPLPPAAPATADAAPGARGDK